MAPVAVKVIVDVALPLEQEPSPVATDPDAQSDESILIVLNVVVPELGSLVS